MKNNNLNEIVKMMENAKEFESGLKVKSYEVKDVLNHQDYGMNLLGNEANVPYSMFLDLCLRSGRVNNWKTRTGMYKSDSFIILDCNFGQKDGETEIQKNIDRVEKNVDKDIKKKEKSQKQIEKEIEDGMTLKKDYDAKRQALTRARKTNSKTKITKAEKDAERAKNKYNKFLKSKGYTFNSKEKTLVPTESNSYVKTIKNAENNLVRNENRKEQLTVLKESLDSVFKNRTKREVNEEINENGFVKTSKVYDEPLMKAISKLDENDPNYIKNIAKLEKAKEFKGMTHTKKITYRTILQAPGKKRQSKMFMVQDTVQIDDKPVDYSQSLIYDYELDDNGNVISKKFTQMVDQYGMLQNAKDSYDEFVKVERENSIEYIKYLNDIEEGNKPVITKGVQKVLDAKEKAETRIVELGAYEPLTQSAIRGGYTKPITNNEILVLKDLEVFVECDARVETLEYLKPVMVDEYKYNSKTKVYKLNKKEVDINTFDKSKYDFVTETKGGTKRGWNYKKLTHEQFLKLTEDEKAKIEIKPVINRDKEFKGLSNVQHDGMALIQTGCGNFEKGCTSGLLRNAHFKANASEMNIQGMLKDICEQKGYDWDKWTLTDKYGNKVLAKEVKLITTESAMKIEKNADLLGGSKKDAFDKFNEVREKLYYNAFGTVKSEHGSKLGDVQRSSYQVFQSLNFGNSDEVEAKNIKDLLDDNFKRINKLKENDDEFVKYMINHIDLGKDGYTTNDYAYTFMLNENNKFIKTKQFRTWKSDVIKHMTKEVMDGRPQFTGDNMVVMGDPMLLIAEAVEGHEEVSKNVFKYSIFGKENPTETLVATRRFDNNKKIGFTRSPHANEASLNVGKNVGFENLECEAYKGIKLDDYFKPSKNMIIVDGTKKPVQATCGGMDYDLTYRVAIINYVRR